LRDRRAILRDCAIDVDAVGHVHEPPGDAGRRLRNGRAGARPADDRRVLGCEQVERMAAREAGCACDDDPAE